MLTIHHERASICLLSAKLGRIFIVKQPVMCLDIGASYPMQDITLIKAFSVKHSMIIFSVVDSMVAPLTSDLAPT